MKDAKELMAWVAVVTSMFGLGCCCPVAGARQGSLLTEGAAGEGGVAKQSIPPSGEGMWPWDALADLDEEALRERGLELPLADIWTPGKGGLASAVVGLSGCTASFVSPDGLMITNHHCVFRAIQRNSTPERNLLEDGFLAGSRDEELDGHGIKAFVFQSQRDVTAEVLSQIPTDISDGERMTVIEAREKELVKACEQQENTRCRVSRNNDGLGFVLLTNTELKDVRLVAAPPRALGEYGGEVDNWHWPRHTMDFSLVRAYVDKHGRPAEYSPDNVPYHPDRHFTVSREGIAKGDLAMVLGTPYATRRYRSAEAVRQDLEWYYPLRVELFEEWTGVLERVCEDDETACLPGATMLKGLNNALTNARGMIAGLERNDILGRKARQEAAWREWVGGEPQRVERFGRTLDELESYLKESRAGRDRDFVVRYMLYKRASGLLGFARIITKWAAEQGRPDADREPGYQERDRENLAQELALAQRNIHPRVDRSVLGMFLRRLGQLPATERLAAIEERLGGDYSAGAIGRFLDGLFESTRLGEESVRGELFGADLAALGASDDGMIQLALALRPELDAWDERLKSRAGAMSRLRPPYIESLVEMRGSRFYPDANATPRISFATVAGYTPRDGVWHTPFTTLGGMAAKHKGEAPFDVPTRALQRIRDGDFDVPSCFLSNADTTGGNSGSPAIDGAGRLVGLNFDRVYENIAGDYGYNPPLSRNIMVDIRAVLWFLDRVLGAQWLLEELGVSTVDVGL